MSSNFRKFTFAFTVIVPATFFSLTYEVYIEGVSNQRIINSLKDASNLFTLEDRPPSSINGLRYRIDGDIPEILKVLRAYSYYDAKINTRLEGSAEPYQVYIDIDLGKPFNLASYEVFHGDCDQLANLTGCVSFTPEVLGLKVGEPAVSVGLVNAELNILNELSKCGYPLAYIEKRRVVVDMAESNVKAASCVQEGPITHFGPSTFFGLASTNPSFIESKLAWKEGDLYDSDLVAKTQERLLKSELFSSVYISHGDTLDEKGELPMKFRVTEAKHQKISLGAWYGTVDGPGFLVGWTHRNIGGNGETLSGRAEVSQRLMLGNISFKKPDFPYFDQTYRAFAETSFENIRAYQAYIYRGANYLDGKFSDDCNYSVGTKIEHITTFSAAAFGTYLLFGTPFFISFTKADSLLDATKGFSIVYSATPYQSFFEGSEHFIKQRLTTNFYFPTHPSRKSALAFRIQLGSIAGGKINAVPITKRFLGGSIDDLRGYRYKTLSPVDANNQPIGGRGAVFTSVEWRLKVTSTIGLVPFADFGTVSLKQYPDFTARWFKSVGMGFRYFTFFGPLRFDVGFPLDRRKGIDPKFQIYATVGQSF